MRLPYLSRRDQTEVLLTINSNPNDPRGAETALRNTDLTAKTGFVRLSSILYPNGPIPVSRSTWWNAVKTGRFPKPIKLGPRTTVWRVEDVQLLIKHGIPTKSRQTP